MSFEDALDFWRKQEASISISPDLKAFLVTAWNYRGRKDAYTLYTHEQQRTNFNSAELIQFFNSIGEIPLSPELQIGETFAEFLDDAYGLIPSPGGFPKLPLSKFRMMVQHLAGLNIRFMEDKFKNSPEGWQRFQTKFKELLQGNLTGAFLHYRRAGSQDCSERIYLSVKPAATAPVMRHVVLNMLQQIATFPGLTNAKVSAPGHTTRADTIVMYFRNENDVKIALDELARYQEAGNRHYFLRSSPRTTRAIRQHNKIELPGVSTGAEPKGDVYVGKNGALYYKRDEISSFGSFRSTIIDFALEQTVKANGNLDGFIKKVVHYLKATGIDPTKPYK